MRNITCYLLIAISVGFASCSKKDSTPASSSTNTNSNAITVNSTPQFTGTINGTSYSLVNGSTYASGVGSSKQMGGSSATANYEEPNSSIGNNSTNHPFFTINRGTITFPLSSSMPDTATYDEFFAIGSCPYSYQDTNGIEIDWIDPSGNIYSTTYTGGSQTGSTFTIVAKKESYVLGNYLVTIVANFSCTLYNTSTGASVKLTNGTYVGSFEDQ